VGGRGSGRIFELPWVHRKSEREEGIIRESGVGHWGEREGSGRCCWSSI